MEVLLCTDVRLMTLAGRYYLYSAFGSILTRYAGFYGSVTLACRLVQIEKVDKYLLDVTPYIKKVIAAKSLKDCFLPAYTKKLNSEIKQIDLVIVRAPSIISVIASRSARKNKKPYLAEAMGDAWDANWNHSIAGKIIAPFMLWEMKRIFEKADFGLYVTSKFLQQRYPCKGLTEGISNVKIQSLSKDVLQQRYKHIEDSTAKKIRLMTTAAVDVRFKGQEYVIRALKELGKRGVNAEYYLAGSGDQGYLKQIAKQEGVADQIVFLGQLSRDEVMAGLDETDIYVQPSLQEGLPRAVVEAMSRGCPCIGARTAGIPELLEDRFVVKRKSVVEIADAVEEFLSLSTVEKKEIAKRNFIEAGKYEEEKLDIRRNAFFSRIKEQVEKGIDR